jgi:hypothetical protein
MRLTMAQTALMTPVTVLIADDADPRTARRFSTSLPGLGDRLDSMPRQGVTEL